MFATEHCYLPSLQQFTAYLNPIQLQQFTAYLNPIQLQQLTAYLNPIQLQQTVLGMPANCPGRPHLLFFPTTIFNQQYRIQTQFI